MNILKAIVQSLLRWAARRQIAAARPFVVGVTGSSGKTSTKEAIGQVLTATLPDRLVIVASGNLNTEFGLPLVILGLAKPEGKLAWLAAGLAALGRGLAPPTYRKPVVYVLEYGVQSPGDMKQLLAIALPDVAVVTNIGTVHFGSLAATAREKGQLVRALPPAGLAILNSADKAASQLAELTEATTIRVDGTPRQLAIAMATSVAVHAFGIKTAVAEAALRGWQPPLGRLTLLAGLKGSYLLDDSYNANQQSMTLALSELRRLGAQLKAKRLVVALGDMLELGAGENKEHLGIALLAQRVADLVVLVGPRFRRTKQGLAWFPGPAGAAAYLREELRSGDLVLVKGSQDMRMEKVSEAILDRTLDPATVLVRQTKHWKAKPYVAP